MQYDTRTILVNKQELIKKIKENKAKHIIEFEKAVEAYRAEAGKQLATLSEELKIGKIGIKLNLTTPENKSEEYDKLIEMFNWEVKDEVELQQGEFNEYILDESSFARQARLSNAFYVGG